MDLLAREEQVGRDQKLLSFMSLYRLPAGGMAQIKDMCQPTLRVILKMWGFQTQKIWIKSMSLYLKSLNLPTPN